MTTATAAPKSKVAPRFEVVIEDDGVFRIHSTIRSILDENYDRLDDREGIYEAVFASIPVEQYQVLIRNSLVPQLVESHIRRRNSRATSASECGTEFSEQYTNERQGGIGATPRTCADGNGNGHKTGTGPRGAMASILDPDGRVRWWLSIDGQRKEVRDCTVDDLRKVESEYEAIESQNRAKRLRLQRLRERLQELGYDTVSQLPEDEILAAITSEDF